MQSNSNRAEDEDTSSEIRSVLTPNHDRHQTENISSRNPCELSLVNGRINSIRDAPETEKSTSLYADPWIRRCDQPSPIDFLLKQNQKQRQKSIQYESRLYYHSLPSTSDDHIWQQQQQGQPLLPDIDKDIEYVESRLRGQTTVSLPTTHSTTFAHENTWRRSSNRNYPNILSSNDPPPNRKSSNLNPKQSSNDAISANKANKTPTNENIKPNKRRIEKIKDQKAAKTLR